MPNDQWDLDWAFERQIVDLPVDGVVERVVITAGKPAVYDALDAATGKYLFSIDLGIQNFITHIDPLTGAKSVDSSRIPGTGQRMTVCPHVNAGRSWMPASYNASTRIVYTYANEACMDFLPAPSGEVTLLTTGVWWSIRPMPGSDGKYGRLQAVDLTERSPVWTLRQRSPFTTGLLATQGGVLFAGSMDRYFSAFDSSSGKELWKVRLNEVPNAAPITYLAHGRQFVAVVAARRSFTVDSFRLLTPENALPDVPGASSASATLWVFELGRLRRARQQVLPLSLQGFGRELDLGQTPWHRQLRVAQVDQRNGL